MILSYFFVLNVTNLYPVGNMETKLQCVHNQDSSLNEAFYYLKVSSVLLNNKI